MSCSSDDLKSYLLGELPESERRQVEEELAANPESRLEFDRLQMTLTALSSVRDEEIPKRIAFVSDKVFEPSWWQRLWQSGPRLGFAAAAMLSLAIVVHAVTRPTPVVGPAPLDAAAIEAIVDKQVAVRLEAAVARAVADSEARQAGETAELLAAAERRFEEQRQEDRLAAQATFEVLRKRMNVMYMASVDRGGLQ